MKRCLLFAAVLGLMFVPCSIDVHAQSTACTVAALQAKAPKGTTITGAEKVAAAGSVPAHCRVDGHATSSGNEVNFRLALPEGWNGKFLFLGVGGLGGTIANLSSGLMRGYASASTDTASGLDACAVKLSSTSTGRAASVMATANARRLCFTRAGGGASKCTLGLSSRLETICMASACWR